MSQQKNLKGLDISKNPKISENSKSEPKTSRKESETSKLASETSRKESESFKGEDSKVTRMIILGPSASISQTELIGKLHMMELPLTIKSTCYGAIVNGEEEVVKEAVEKIRKLDYCNIFTKDRGFPPGDPRRCRAKRGAAREGYHQLEKEFELLDFVSAALQNPKKVSVEKPKKVPVDLFKEICKKCEKECEE
jgi:putative methanogenesis marker protein 6